MFTLAVPVETTLNVPLVNNDDGSAKDPPDPAPVTEYSTAAEVFDPFTHETDPVLDGAVLDTDILLADEGNGVVLETDILDIVGWINVVNEDVCIVPVVPLFAGVISK